LRQALLGTWRLISYQIDAGGTLVKPFGDNPQGYLVYTPDGHVLVQMATRALRAWPPSPEIYTLPQHQLLANQGIAGYCGTFEVRDGQTFHHREFGLQPRHDGTVEARSVVLDGDRLILGTARGAHVEWQRVH
jgi:hypothetical protein